MRRVIFYILGFLFVISFGYSEEKVLFSQNFDKVTLKELTEKGIVNIPKYNHWKIENGALVQSLPRYYSGKIIIGNKNWVITKIEFDFQRIEYGLPTKHGYDNHTGVGIWGLTIWAREKYLHWKGHIPKTGNKPTKVGGKKASFELKKWYHFSAEREKDGKVKVYINNVLFTTIPYSPKETGPVVFYTYRIKSAFDNIKIYGNKKEEGEKLSQRNYNFVPNSSFEYTTNPSMPDFWTTKESLFSWAIYKEEWTSEEGYKVWHEKFKVDRTNAYDGRNSIKVTYPLDLASTRISISADKRYTFSAYLKSDKESLTVKMGIMGNDRKIIIEKEINVDKKWKRYVLTTPTVKTGNIYIYFVPLKEGTFWVDAVKLETGSQLTAYSHSPLDEIIFKKKETVKGTAKLEIPKIILEEKIEKILIDGKLNEPIWLKSTPFLLKQMDGKNVEDKTEFYIAYDENNIYVGIKCYDSAMDKKGLICEELKRDSFEIFGNDSVEIFITPEETGKTYFQLVFNAYGSQFDQKCVSGKGIESSWNGNWKVRTDKGDRYWTAEVEIPFEDFIKEGLNIGKIWRINVCRNNIKKRELQTWSPTLTGFHVPERFGYLYFGSYFICYEIGDISLMWHSHDKKNLKFVIKNKGESETDINVYLKTKKGTFTYPEKINLKPEEAKTVNFVIKIDGENFKGEINIEDSKTKKLVYTRKIDINCTPLIDAYFERSYYTDEKVADLYIKTFISEKTSRDISILVKLIGTNFGKKIISPLRESRISIPIKNLQSGVYECIIKILYKGKEFSQFKTELKKLPKNLVEVKIDRIKNTILVNGKPFFVFAPLWEHPPGKKTMEYLKKCGFKSIVIVWRPGDKKDKVRKVLDWAKDNNLLVVAWPSPSGMHLTEKGLGWLITQIREFKDHPSIIAWYVFDEPGHDGILQRFVDEAKKEDPYRIAAANYHSFALNLKIGGMPGEIISLDRYPIPRESIYTVESTAKEMYEISSARKSPLWYILQNLGYAFACWRDPTPSEQEFMTYTTVITGATGLMYFTGLSKSVEHWEKIKSLNKEIQFLAPVLFSPEEVPQIKVSNNSIRYLLKKYQETWYLISLNREEEDIEATIDLSSLGLKDKSAEVLFEDRKIEIEKGRFTDKFAPFQRHIYKIRGK